MSIVSKLGPAAWLVIPSLAQAGTVVLTPLLIDGTVDSKLQLGVHQLIASELDFSPQVSGVVDLDRVPAGLDQSCFASSRCLGGIASANAGEEVLTGSMTASGADLVLDLVFFDGERVSRRKAFSVPSDPTGLANAMTPVINEMLTGDNPAASAASNQTAMDFNVEDELERPDIAGIDAAAGIGADPDADVALINFGGTVDDISAQEVDSMITFGAPPGVTATPAPAPVPAPMVASTADTTDPEPKPPRRERTPRPPKERSTTTKPIPTDHTVQLTGRGGYSKYYAFDFITGGAEAAVRMSDGLHMVVGFEMYLVNRELPLAVQAIENKDTEWDTIFPVNLGLIYKIPLGAIQPYLGADMIFAQYYKDDKGSDWAGGARARLGLDLMVTANFGLNANVAAGAWTGQNFDLIEVDVEKAGFLPQISGGTVFSF